MSTLEVKVEKILDIQPHPNADRLELATVRGWICIVMKGLYRPGDKCIYIPIDSILPFELEEKLFAGAKVRLHNGRIRTIKLRGCISQGLVVDPAKVDLKDVSVGADVTDFLGIKKYEPPVKSASFKAGTVAPRRLTNPLFKKYTKIENFKNHPWVFKPGEMVSVTEKVHGTNWRAGILEFHANTIWKKIKKLLGLAPKYEFVYGSHNVQKQERRHTKANGFYEDNVYYEAVKKYNIKSLLRPGMVLYGEVYGDGIQKNYHYGCGKDERKLVIFDIMIDGEYLSPQATFDMCKELGLPTVPELYRGPFDEEKVAALTEGNSILVPEQEVIEGVVVKSVKEENDIHVGRKVLKYISDEYLLNKHNTDFH